MEEYINFIVDSSVPKAITLAEIIKATNEDRTLKGLRAAITLIFKEYKNIKDELSITSHGLILRGTRIVVPLSLRQRAIDIAHEAHLGIQKTIVNRKTDMVRKAGKLQRLSAEMLTYLFAYVTWYAKVHICVVSRTDRFKTNRIGLEILSFFVKHDRK